ncbi:methylaspartate ammonia-lyase [Acetohalobium arabaticum]|uniref:methylaspartate ammonia-lyase n=1 Tax=Acetohalobium arabaticum (strain ATCC 49924 / DSM 5501 / Z-7288) TaxID=574087 RepID=D9QUW7_ACEAZ|nr:methylaspartate ammonia-lyase [Acetohalobium arabaticum]ADL12026.1 methylaspartate ammonia-lyase [Acetohalobium arabaticum DSM 5501]
MKIEKIVTSPGLTGFYFDDQRAIKEDAEHDGLAYLGDPVTEGFSSIRQAGESISVMIILEDGQVAYGDCAAVQYSGAGGRDPLFLAEEFIPIIEEDIAPKLVGREMDSFKELAEEFDNLKVDGERLHTAIRYGITQALLDAVAKSKNKTMTEVVAEEYGLDLVSKPVPIFAQTGDDRYLNADKMIIKHADVIPHALINNVKDKLGEDGDKLLDYVEWLKNRVSQLRTEEDYEPIFHIDVYGTIGLAFDNDPEAMADYLEKLAAMAKPHTLRIEGPMDSGSRADQVADMKALRDEVKERGIDVELVADEWCNTFADIKKFVDEEAADVVQIKTPDLGGINNTIEAVLYCKENGVGAYQGGTCNETDRSAQVCVNLALATRPDQMLAKPGMGVDEGLMIVNNEMNRVLSLIEACN